MIGPEVRCSRAEGVFGCAWHTDLLVTHGVLHPLRDASRYRVVLAAFADALLH